MKKRSLLLTSLVILTSACGIIPTPTPEIVRETVEVDVTREVTREIVITATPEPTSTHTPEPPLIFEDDFESGEGDWDVVTMPEGYVSIENGELMFNLKVPDNLMYTGNPKLDYLGDFDLEFDLRFVSGSRMSQFYINLNEVNVENMYVISVDADGFYSFGMYLEDIWYDYIPYTQSDAFNLGRNTNHIRLVRDGIQICLYVNEELLFCVPAEWLPRGYTYFVVATWEEGDATWAIDNIKVRTP